MLQKNHSSNSIMPLMMNFTKPSPVMEGDDAPAIVYDDFAQIVEINLATIGTKSLKTTSIHKVGSVSFDKKNEIDDSKMK